MKAAESKTLEHKTAATRSPFLSTEPGAVLKRRLKQLCCALVLALVEAVCNSAAAAASDAIKLRKGAFVIVCGSDEPESVRIAVEALQRDIKAVTGAAIEIRHSVPESASTPALVVVDRARDVPATLRSRLRPLGGYESHRIYADAPMKRVYLDGYDARGTIYAIYSFSEHLLGVPPLHFWCSWQAVHQDTIRIPAEYDRFAHSPQVRFRALLPGDTDFFAPWRARSPAHDGMWLETALRLKLNTVEAYSTIEPGNGMSSDARLISRYGLVLASHHTSGLNTSFDLERVLDESPENAGAETAACRRSRHPRLFPLQRGDGASQRHRELVDARVSGRP